MGSPMRGRCVEVVFVDDLAPKTEDITFDEERLKAKLSLMGFNGVFFPLKVLRKLPKLLRENDFKVWLILLKTESGWEVVEASLNKPKKVLGVAVDLGSTGIAFYVYDYLKSQLVEKYSILNPQIEVGEDILTRLHFARKEKNLEYIRKITVEAINKELIKFGKDEVFYLSICGNTVMSHFLAGLPVDNIFMEPRSPVVKDYGIRKAEEYQLDAHPLARTYVFPSVGPYFGGDIIAGLFYSGIHRKEDGFYFFIDVGTNAEVVLGNRDFLLACSGAAGPALEGGIFECGCQAKPGAITTVRITKEELEYQTLNQEKPVCICGSGVIDLIAELFKAGLLSYEGKLLPNFMKERFKKLEDELVFIVAFKEETSHGRDIYIKESEIKSFLRSKGAMHTILTLLCEKVGLSFEDIERFYIAGTFGNHIKVESAVTLGMLPKQALYKAEGLGNAAGEGALKFLIEPNLDEIKHILRNTTFIELNKEPRFMELFAGSRFIPVE